MLQELHDLVERENGDRLRSEVEGRLYAAGLASLVPHALAGRAQGGAQKRRRDERRDERHYHRDAEEPAVEDRHGRRTAGRVLHERGRGDSGYDEDHLAPRDHAYAHAQRADGREAHRERRRRASHHLSYGRHEREEQTHTNDCRIRKDPCVHKHAHSDEERRDEEGGDGLEGRADAEGHVRPRKRQTRHESADDHGQSGLLEKPGHEKRDAQRHRRQGGWGVEALEGVGEAARKGKAEGRHAEPDGDATPRDEADRAPIHASAAQLHAGHADHDGEADDA